LLQGRIGLDISIYLTTMGIVESLGFPYLGFSNAILFGDLRRSGSSTCERNAPSFSATDHKINWLREIPWLAAASSASFFN
jgi:hypothetical protein